MKIIAFIPARSGSTRLKNKNIKLFNGRPLIYWTVIKALKSKKFDRIIFSSDSKNYYKILLRYLKKDNIKHKILEFDFRENKHSKTKSKIFDYLKYDFIKKHKLCTEDLIVQLLPTCPLRSIKNITNTINISVKYKSNSFTVCKYDFHISFGLTIENKNWKPAFKNSPLITGQTQSQDQKIYFHPNGSVSCLFVKTLSKLSKTIYYKAIPVPVSRKESLDIDSKEDFILAEKIYFS